VFIELKKLAGIFLILLFLGVSTAVFLYLDLMKSADYPSNPERSITAIVVIKPGQQFKTIPEHLHRLGILKEPFKFGIYARIKHLDKRIKAGEYQLSSVMSPKKILHKFVSGKVRQYKVTLPEGYSLNQIAVVIAGAGLATKEAFMKAVYDSDRIHSFGINADSFEGYLFPDTYYFSKGIPIEKIISAMVNRFQSQFNVDWKQQAEKIGFSIHEIVTLASIIEKETGAPFERPVISSVFHNRLKKKMRLESDPTVIYGIEGFDGNITRKHLNTQTPYNTYRKRGLPPGPIANPGSAAIEAALYPDDTSFLFFVSKKDGTHKFSTTISEHNRAVRKYQLRKR
jgi:UPF0755 protein